MKMWQLGHNDPGEYILAADARCGPTDYGNDHIWELMLRGGEPSAFALHTTFGLRARNLRMFPRFTEGDTSISNPDSFAKAPRIHRVYPNYILSTFAPFTGINVQLEIWVPDSHSITGRIHISNQRLSARELRFEWGAQLSSNQQGERMNPAEMEAAIILFGKTGDLTPVLFITGGAHVSSGPYPALALDLNLPAGGSRTFRWCLSATGGQQESFESARRQVARPWEKEIARLDALNAGLIEVETGNPDWDAAFMLTQKSALRLLCGPTEHLPHPSFVLSRQPDQGYSARDDGRDYTHSWNGQTPMETDFLSGFLLPAYPNLARGLLLNFLSVQQSDGFIDWKPGLGGQRSNIMATPMLTQLAWKIYQFTEDGEFLTEVYPKLLKAVQAWFSPQQDRDGDGIPEWQNLMQINLDEHPAFSPWQPNAQGADISTSESPALCALLYAEIQTLLKMAQVLERTETIPALQSLADNLQSAITSAWDESTAMYRIWDRESHHSPGREILADQYGPGEIAFHSDFDEPVRLVILIEGHSETPRRANIYIHGTGSSGKPRVEHIAAEQLQWRLAQTSVTSQRVYTSLEFIDMRDIGPDDHVHIEVMDLSVQDISLFLPLMAETETPQQAEQIIRKSLLNPERFWQPYGIPLYPPNVSKSSGGDIESTSVMWSSLIGRGLLSYGYQSEAAELVNRLMSATLFNLKKYKAFSYHYHTGSAQGVGERHALPGLAPLPLFMETLGIRLISPTKVMLVGYNPFPWPVTVKYRGLIIYKDRQKTRVTFPGGQTAVVKNPEPHLVSVE